MIPQRRSAWSSEASRRNSGAVMLLPGGRSGRRAMARVMTDRHHKVGEPAGPLARRRYGLTVPL